MFAVLTFLASIHSPASTLSDLGGRYLKLRARILLAVLAATSSLVRQNIQHSWFRRLTAYVAAPLKRFERLPCCPLLWPLLHRHALQTTSHRRRHPTTTTNRTALGGKQLLGSKV